MDGFVLVNNTVSTLTVTGQEKARALWTALDYAINNSPNLTPSEKAELSPVRDGLQTVFDL